ncbi:MAG: subtype II CRISPR-associated endonuclease Cas2 [Rhodobacteraceae bacterium HLUCCA12]|nr:MAG: subtype II CRISPR-associated endonuclease Cas2 [Rhodobacteraceae bacterium HLUCCA12]
MWVWVLFDLPVLTSAERKRATRFRNDLLELGFNMVQFSVYLRHAWSKEKAESYARQVGDLVPDPGHVQVLFFTDKQYALSQVFQGKRRSKAPAEKPAQLVLF